MRRKDREVTDTAEIARILAAAKVLRLGLMDGDYPYIVPLHYGYMYAGDVLRFYMHGAKAGKKYELIQANVHAFAELDTDVEATGEGDVACIYGANYASLMARGKVVLVEESREKIQGLKLLMSAQTGREFAITEEQAAGVAVFRFDADSFSVKKRHLESSVGGEKTKCQRSKKLI